MKQTASIISTYAADVSGVCSALYELGGMTVMHDPSGCNSTYNTHDEPRWYDFDSLIFISALSEMEAIMGDDDRLIDEVTETAKELKPKFIAIAGSPIPMVIGTDFKAIARVIETRTGIPCFGFTTNGMHSYLSGVGMAFQAFAQRMVDASDKPEGKHRVNILGATPLDFSINGSIESVKDWLKHNGFELNSCWAMGSELDELIHSGRADVNLVISQSGISVAKFLQKQFGTPYVVGVPVGKKQAEMLAKKLFEAEKSGVSITCPDRMNSDKNQNEIVLIGEGVFATAIASAIEEKLQKSVHVLCPLECESEILSSYDIKAKDEEELIPYLEKAQVIIADPLYRPICPSTAQFVGLGHEAFSGRIYRSEIPNLINKGFDEWFSKNIGG